MPGKLLAGGTCQSWTSLSEFSNGKGRRRTPFTTLKMAVLAPIPNARTRIASRAKPGALRRARKAYLRSVSKVLIRLLFNSSDSHPTQFACRVPATTLYFIEYLRDHVSSKERNVSGCPLLGRSVQMRTSRSKTERTLL